MGDIANQVKAAGYCKRDLPSLNQIKAFLKKEHGASKEILDGINENNVTEKFAEVVQGGELLILSTHFVGNQVAYLCGVVFGGGTDI